MMMGVALAFGSVGTLASPAMAQTEATQESPFEARAADVVSLIEGEGDATEVFSPTFLAQVSAEQFATISQQLTAQLGDIVGVESVEPTGENAAQITLRFEKALASGPMTLEAEAPYQISGLLLNDIKPVATGPDAISADMEALSGSAAAWFGPLDGEAIYTYGDTAQPFAIGSTFKLYVLAALSRAVSEGRLAWDDVIPLDAKSFPSGIMQNWPDGAPVTLHTAATLMISISDNTATDLLMRTVGREAIEAEMRASGHADPAQSFPFLTTREMFVIKSGDLGEAFAAASEAQRREMLAALDLSDIDEERFYATFTSGTPVLIEDIEWFASMADQRALMRVLAALPEDTARQIMAVNTVFDEEETAGWDYVGYKGGSEAGVLNMSWLLRDEAGRWHMLAIAQMDPTAEVDTTSLLLLAKRILALAE
ncbi:MAG: serine hydrolase [Citromicrobium sp.]|nr:serine hydrolase [Citromicrobium sp.]